MSAESGKKRRWLGVAAFVATVCASTLTVQARSPWFTGQTADGQTVPISSVRDGVQLPKTPPGAKAVAGGEIDVVISTHANWQGDEDGNVQGGAGNAEQDRFERIVQNFADAIYEMTEGAHKVRKVRIYRKYDNQANADVQWHPKGHPHVPGNGGVGEAGGHVNMYDTFENGILYADGTTGDKDMLADEKGAGYTMAHEYGHYFYGLYDEYEIRATDVPVNPSVMHSQWQASSQGAKWLNFSIAYQAANPTGPFVNTRQTAQHRAFAESAWETLARNTDTDPVNLGLGKRVYYPLVGAKAPTTTNTPAINLPSANARASLDIIWMGQSVYEIVLDSSGSMNWEEGKGENTVTAARLFIQQVPLSNYVGVIDFDSSVTEVVPITQITSEAVRQNIMAQIANDESGGTSIGAALTMALSKVQAAAFDGLTKSVLLLTDGQSGDNALAPIPAYQNAQVPIIAFGYGNDADPVVLQQLASATGGRYFFSPVSLAEIAGAFQSAGAFLTGSPTLASGTQAARGSESRMSAVRIPFEVDSTLDSFSVLIGYTGVPENTDLVLVSPGRDQFEATSVNQSSTEVVLAFDISASDVVAGKWWIRGKAAGGLALDYQIIGLGGDLTFSLSAESESSTVQFPTPIRIIAKLSRGLPISGATVEALVTGPNGIETRVVLANTADGTYEGVFNAYTGSGSYTVEVSANNQRRKARYTVEDSFLTPVENGEDEPFKGPQDQAIKERFGRVSTYQVQVSGAAYSPVGTNTTWRPPFLYPADTNVSTYRITLESSNNGVYRTFARASVKQAKYPWRPRRALPLGAYRWHVAWQEKVVVGVTAKGKPRYKLVWQDGPAQEFTRVPLVPADVQQQQPEGEVEYSEVRGAVMTYQWLPTPNAESYELTIQRKNNGEYRNFKRIRYTPGGRKLGIDGEVSIKGHRAGEYRWFIRAVSTDGSGPLSAAMEFVIK